MSRHSRTARRIAALTATLALLVPAAALLLAYSGIYNVAASEGHLKPVDWFLRFGMRRSVALHSGIAERPGLGDRGMVELGASHYHSGCAVCHGAPGQPQSPVFTRMLPEPPRLAGRAREWDAAELFWIVKHGLKYTGMPAWSGAERDDEIWPMVAFLVQLPAIDEQSYHELIAGDGPRRRDPSGRATAGEPGDGSVAGAAVSVCARCHDTGATTPVSSATPRLAGQPPQYLRRSLREYRDNARQSGFMEPVAVVLEDEQILQHARHFAALQSPALPPPQGLSEAEIRRGRQLAERGHLRNKVPPCEACHGARALDTYPRLAGQSAPYMEAQLDLWKDGGRAETAEGVLMAAIANRLDAEQISAVARYYQSLGSVPGDPEGFATGPAEE